MDTTTHWEQVHATKGQDVSWWQGEQDLWVDLITDLDPEPNDPIVDIGSGSSMLLDSLHARGFRDLTAVDVSESALDALAGRLGDAVTLVQCDAVDFHPSEPVRVWHDRAVFHFLTDPSDQQAYREHLHAGLRPDGFAVICTFAPDGPQTCSGLPVQRYAPEDLARTLDLTLVREDRRIHTTPWQSQQPFTIAVLRP